MDRRSWFKGGWFIDSWHAIQRCGVFTLLARYPFPLGWLVLGVLLLSLTWFIPRSPIWRSTILRFVAENPIFVAALLLSLVLPLFWLFLWKLPQWQVAALPEMKDRIDLESKVRQTMAQILGGAAFLVGLYFTSQTLHVSQQGQITDRFTKAIGQLGTENLAVRLGGIYALERIARDSESDHWAVMEVLTAFVREQTQGRLHTSQAEVAIRGSKPPTDIQAILTVIGRRTRTYGKGESERLDLNASQLEGAHLTRAQLEGAHLARAQLEGALLGEAQLEGAFLGGAQLKGAFLGGAQLKGAFLRGAQLKGALLTRAQLEGAYLEGAQLEGAHLEGAQLEGAHLEGAQLEGAFLGGAQLKGAYLEGAQLKGAYLEGAQLKGAYLSQDQINTACVDEHTTLPEELTRPAPCPIKP